LKLLCRKLRDLRGWLNDLGLGRTGEKGGSDDRG
jgi:hypothetical protein